MRNADNAPTHAPAIAINPVSRVWPVWINTTLPATDEMPMMPIRRIAIRSLT